MGNWEHKIMTEEDMKTLVKDVYDAKVFTSLHLRGNDDYLISSIFMPIMFLGAAPTKPSLDKNNQINRKNKLQYIEDCLTYERETPEREAFLNEIGMLYEDNSKAGPRSINGYPMFFSCKILSKADAKRFMEMYNKYVKMREEFEKQW